MGNEVRKVVKDAGDAVKEGVHRADADIEHERRAEYGDVMTPGEKAESVGREVSSDVKAEGDRLKREIRDKT